MEKNDNPGPAQVKLCSSSRENLPSGCPTSTAASQSYVFSCSTQLSMRFISLKNVEMPTIVRILTFMSRMNFMLS